MVFNATLLGQALTFAILVWFTMKFVWPPLTHMLDERAKRIAAGLAAAERGQQDLAAAEKRAQELLHIARDKVTDMLHTAEKRAHKVIEEATLSAQQEKLRIIAEAKVEIDQEVIHAREALRSQLAGLALDGAQKILEREIDSTQHAELLASIKAEF